MSDMRLKFALSNGGTLATDTDMGGLQLAMTAIDERTSLGIPGWVINGAHIVAIEIEAINRV